MRLFLFAVNFLLYIRPYNGAESATQQLSDWKNANSVKKSWEIPSARDPEGHPVPSLTASLSVGSQGPILLQDVNILNHLASFNRERIPERVVHAKGGGAFGYFQVTHDISRYTKAKVFDTVGKKTPVLVRFSSVGGEAGSADTVRDPRGFAVKFYTEDGNWDLVGNNIINFPIRDPILFPSFIHSRKRNPATHLADENSFWDFTSLRSESTLHTMILFSDLGLPDGFRKMDGFGVHTFKLVNNRSEPIFVKFHWRTQQGIKNLSPETAEKLAGSDPDYSIRDLYDAILNKEFPEWNLYIQVMTFEQAKIYKWNPFDITKFWLYTDYPLIPVGKMILTRNPSDYFTEIEQATFAPGNLVGGIEASPDRMLHGRMFAYPDAHRYRVGSNHAQLPVNRPRNILTGDSIHTYIRDGHMCFGENGVGSPNYFPNSFKGPIVQQNSQGNGSNVFVEGADEIRAETGDDDNFSLATHYWNVFFSLEDREKVSKNIATHLALATDEIRQRAVANFNQVHSEFGKMVAKNIKMSLKLLVPEMNINNIIKLMN